MIHEWHQLKMLKWSGHGHLKDELETQSHSCALLCPASIIIQCTDSHTLLSWLYTFFLALDGNFHMSQREVSNDEQDPSLTQNHG